MNSLKGILISDFTIENLRGYLINSKDEPKLDITIAPYNQIHQTLQQIEKEQFDFAVVWTLPNSSIKSFDRLFNFESTNTKEILDEVNFFSDSLKAIADKVKFVFVISWTIDPLYKGRGMLDMKGGIGVSNAIFQMNLRLAENLKNYSNYLVLDSLKWISIFGKESYNDKLWYLSKTPFDNNIFLEAAKDIKSAIRGILGQSKKLIIVDLDNTLWGGEVGDVGWENIRLGGHDAAGEAFLDFQKALKSLANKGVILAIVSKNEEDIALDALEKHPEMILRKNDFVGWKINWNDKAQNVMDLVHELNLGLDAVVFIDDNQLERERVREALNLVYVPELPNDVLLYKRFLMNLDCFNYPNFSREDIVKKELYEKEHERKKDKSTFINIDDWLKSLQIQLIFEELNNTNLLRATQLLNKTNQMNLTTRRLLEHELHDWSLQKENKLWTLTLTDRFGNAGLTGIISIKIKDSYAQIIDFVLSCRVIGRKAEEAMLHKAISFAKKTKCNEIIAKYYPTEKNKPCLKFFETSGFKQSGNTFSWNLLENYSIPDFLTLIEQ